MSASGDDQNTECPLCMEPLELDDLNFFPCTCGYQICRFCWHRIRTDENGLCPACRKQYPEDPADFKPLTHEELQRIKSEKRQKDLQRKQKISDNRKHLGNVRVVQKNLVFVVGLSQRLAEPEVLKRNEYFGKFGKIHKVVINHSTSYAGSQGPSASAYVTYCRVEDSLRAIQAVNNIHVDGRTLKASLGTTKYCSHFLKGQQCPKGDCMYLHEIGDDAASFTKEEMQQGKHQEYEKKLHEQLFNSTRKQTLSPTLGTPVATSGNGTVSNGRDSESSTSSSNNSGGSSNGEPVKSGRGKGQNKKEGGTNKNSKRMANTGEEPKRSNKAKSSSENQRNGRTRGSSKRGSSPSQKSSSEPSSSSVGGDDNVTVSDTGPVLNLERTSSDTSPTPPPLPLSIDPLPVNTTDDSCSLSVGDQSSSLPTSTNGTQSPAQSLTNLDSSSSSAASSLSSSSTDVMQPFFSSRNGFSPLPEPNMLAPQLESTSLEWMCSSPTQDTSSVAQLEPVSTQGSTDWQAAFGFTSVQNNKDDDLGFDPWDESSKALADLMEKETHNGVPFCPPSSSSSSSSMLLNRNNLPYGQVDVVHPLRPLPTRIQQQQQQQQQQHVSHSQRHNQVHGAAAAIHHHHNIASQMQSAYCGGGNIGMATINMSGHLSAAGTGAVGVHGGGMTVGGGLTSALGGSVGVLGTASGMSQCATPNMVAVSTANYMRNVNVQMPSSAATYIQGVSNSSSYMTVGMPAVAAVIQHHPAMSQQGNGATQRLTHVTMSMPASVAACAAATSQATNFYIQTPGPAHTPVPTPTPQPPSQTNTSCSLAKLQQLTNGIMDLVPSPSPCNTMTPPPNLTPPPPVNMTPPPSIQRNLTPPIPSLQSQVSLASNPHYYKSYNRGRQIQRSPNITINPSLMASYPALNGYRMQQGPTATAVLNTAGYLSNTSFINQGQIPTATAVQMGMMNVNVHPQTQYQDAGIQPPRPQNAMYTTYSVYNGGLPPQTLNGIMRR